MILYGRDLSPFVRRVAIWCALQGREVERRKLMVSGEDFETLKTVNPVGRVPILQLEDGESLIETWAICDWLEDTAPATARLVPADGVPRRAVLQEIAYANGAAEKAVALVYDRQRRPEDLHWADWQARLEGQVAGGLQAMEAHCPEDGWLQGRDRPMGGDVAFVCAHDFIAAMHPQLLDGTCPKLTALAARANAMPEFGATKPEV
ncbi:glutathione S-transferase family protein [Rhodovulum sp. DZ06]|uniref:glutathione S-transferase family protein n=1 Tax=Rhodovulum sp. DZ06 TaxID=3425126 RepID=UPI003D34E2BC